MNVVIEARRGMDSGDAYVRAAVAWQGLVSVVGPLHLESSVIIESLGLYDS